MRITDIATFVVGNPPPSRGGRYFIFVTLTTDSGIKGVGEIYVATFSPHLVAELAVDVADRFLVGHDPFRIETFWRRAYGSGYSLRPDPTLVGVMSGLEMACWDIVGKETGRPVYDLLGGQVHERLRTYTYLYPPDPIDANADHPVYTDPDAAAEMAAFEVARGFTGVKFDPAGKYSVFDGRQPSLESIERTAAFCRSIREAVGTRADLLVGTHGQFTPAGAIRMARALEPYDPLWFEEPVSPDDPTQMGVVARQTTIPIASGERLTTKYEFAALLRAGGASILQLNLGRCGGVLEGKKIAALAEVHGAQIAPHLYCGPVVGAANIALATCTPNFLILESIQDWGGFHAEVVSPPIRWENGYVIPPTGPGLGVELNEAVASAHPYSAPELHIEMSPDPPR